MAESVVIVGAGAFTPVGVNTIETSASVFAGLSGKMESAFHDRFREPIVLGYVPNEVIPLLRVAGEGMSHVDRRMVRLAAVALDEAMAMLPERQSPALFWCAPRLGEGLPPDRLHLFFDALQAQFDGVLSPTRKVIPHGRASFFEGVKQALNQCVRQRTHRYAIVGGADSFVDPMRLASLQEEDRLPREGASDSFVPGEGAAFVAVATERVCREDGLVPLARLLQVGVGFEEGHRYSSLPYKGEGLAQTMTSVLGKMNSGESIRTVFAGFNGESFHAKEWGVGFIRNREHFAEPLSIEHPAEYTGDLGAALAPMMTVVAASGLFDGETPGPVLVFGSSDAGERGALVLHSVAS